MKKRACESCLRSPAHPLFRTYYFFIWCFFFSSRRRHTRSLRDWSSDVCSSDLEQKASALARGVEEDIVLADAFRAEQIGRASCRERVEISVVGVSFKKKTQSNKQCVPRWEERRVGRQWGDWGARYLRDQRW